MPSSQSAVSSQGGWVKTSEARATERSRSNRCMWYLKEWLALPVAWLALICIVILGLTLGGSQLIFGLIMLIASPILRRSFLAVVRILYPTRIGVIHVWFLLFIRKYWLKKKRHSMPIRIDISEENEPIPGSPFLSAQYTASSSRSSFGGGGHGWSTESPGRQSTRAGASIHVIPGLLDNYSYIIVDRTPAEFRRTEKGVSPLQCCVIDPGDGAAVVAALSELREQHYDRSDRAPASRPVSLEAGGRGRPGRQNLGFSALSSEPNSGTASPSSRPRSGVHFATELGASPRPDTLHDETNDGLSIPPSPFAGPLLRRLASERDHPKVILTSILVTHKHWDHQAGVGAVLKAEEERTRAANKKYGHSSIPKRIRVVAGVSETGVRHRTHAVAPGHIERVGRLRLEVIPSPCHTAGHIMFALELAETSRSSNEAINMRKALFTGDTLFCGGCGAPFEGSQQDMAHNFRRIFHHCSGDCLLFPGHEYSEPLLLEYFGGSQPAPWPPHQFSALCHALQRARDCRSQRRPSVPIVLKYELLYNNHFASLHQAAARITDAWASFSNTVNARAASNAALATLRKNCHRNLAAVESTLAASTSQDDTGKKTATPLGLDDLLEPKKNTDSAVGAPPSAEDASAREAGAAALARFVARRPGLEEAHTTGSLGPLAASTTRAVRHSVTVRRGWRAGDHVVVDVAGVDVDVCVPEGLSPGQSFDVRIPRDKLPPLLVYEATTFSDPLATLWMRDLERLSALVDAAQPLARRRLHESPTDDTCIHDGIKDDNFESNASFESSVTAIRRAKTLCNALLNAPLRDARDYDESTQRLLVSSRNQQIPYRKRGGTLPRARYRGVSDERTAQLSAESRAAGCAQNTTKWQLEEDETQRSLVGVDLELEAALATERDPVASYTQLLASDNNDDHEDDWHLDLKDAPPIFEALCALSANADATVRDTWLAFESDEAYTISRTELRRALMLLGPRPLGFTDVERLLDVAEIAGSVENDDPELINCKRLALVLGLNDDSQYNDDGRTARSCFCCSRKGRRRRRRKNKPASSIELQVQHHNSSTPQFSDIENSTPIGASS